MIVDETRLDQLLVNVEDAPCPDNEDSIVNCNDDCKQCWIKFLQGFEIQSTEPPLNLQLASSQLSIDPETLK